ncbi:MAG: PSD1 and planctomycete cytochrome C domain-containing protein [Limisphaerales bacterium]
MRHPARLAAALLLAWANAGAAELSREQAEFFEKKVRPVLVERCYQCHSAESRKTKGGLALDTREATLKGGDSGPVLTAGDPEKSRMIEAVRYQNQDLLMPPKGRLPADEVRALEDWIRMGAPDPRTSTVAAGTGPRPVNIEEGRSFWAFRPVVKPAVPQVSNARFPVQSPVDAFTLAKLRERGLTPARPADKRVLLRRATFDLTGLPPTPAELDAFLADKSPDAFAKVIERLLDSQRYGERWGRHWLDVARYADSNGLDENVAYGNSWRYRDYVINAFNADKPFDRFIVEQLAGDLVPATSREQGREQLSALGFLSIGAKVLAEPDPKKMEMDIIDEQIETLGRAFMGMTFGCARCHDHKFDPVPTADYYAMAAIFKSTRTMDSFKIVAKWHETSLATPEEEAAQAAFDKRLAAQKSAITTLTNKANAALLADLRARAAEYLVAAARLSAEAPEAELGRIAGEFNLHAPVLQNCRQFLTKAESNSVFHAWHEGVKNGSPAEIEKHYRTLFADVARARLEQKAKGIAATNALADARIEAARLQLDDPKGFLALPAKPEALYPVAAADELKRLREDVAKLEKEASELPSVMSVSEGTNMVKSLAVHIRGSHLTLGREIPRGFPQVMQVASRQPGFAERQSGRLELARWLASPEHPLTARVMVNRIWRWHFGQGLVLSADNFGTLGDRPSHPELLEWLAHRFVAGGWSVKAMHRLIMLSSTYQMSTVPAEPKRRSTEDSENRLLSHFPIRRLEAEEIRDALLLVAGTIDFTMGGKTIPLKNREFVFNHTSKDATSYESPRRAVYLPIIRNNVYDLFEQFDYPDPAVPTGSRNSSVVAPQALLLMNSQLVARSATDFAAYLLAAAGDDAKRLELAYLKAYARQPTAKEVARAKKFLADFERSAGSQTVPPTPQQAWAVLCQALLAANEFIYLN